jgi:hydroxyethylthiazole kinase
MAHEENEVEEMVSLAGALVLNIGTLTDTRIGAMIKAGRKASEKGIPVVFDPVGSGATTFRTASARKILNSIPVRVIRGNASEILSLRQRDSRTRGVDSIHTVDDAAEAGRALAGELDTTLAVTGNIDLVTDGSRVLRVSNGHPMMEYVTGTGCTATVTVAAFSAVDKDPVAAAATALAFYGLAGEIAAEKTPVPGSYMIELINALYTITPERLRRGCRIDES